MKLVVISAGVSDPSSTGLLAGRLRERVLRRLSSRGEVPEARVIELRPIAGEIATGLVSGLQGPGLTAAVEALRDADGVIAATPVYKAGVSGLFKSFIDLLDDDLLVAKPVALAATAGTARHALVVDEAMRSLFAYLRTLTVPTGVFASQEDWGDPALNTRIDRAAEELVALMESGVSARIRAESWGRYSHELGSDGGTELEIALDTEMMRLATGGSALEAPDRGR